MVNVDGALSDVVKPSMFDLRRIYLKSREGVRGVLTGDARPRGAGATRAIKR